MTAITAITAQNTLGVIGIQDISTDIIAKQIDSIFDDIPPDSIKIGMLSNRDTMLTVAEKLRQHKPNSIVLDPVMVATSGSLLMTESAIDTLISEIIPLADLVTPNIPEAEKITGKTIKTHDDMRKAAQLIHAMGCRAVVIKGGHGEGDAVDILFDGTHGVFYEFCSPRVDTKHTHGTGCTFSSAIAANLALGLSVNESVGKAKEYINTAITNAPGLGKGNGPTHHFYELWEKIK
jgi:hydroxymethylpyrimidine/phosphomethylpyrimidine kinase